MQDGFSFRTVADGRVLISRGGRLVATIAGQRAERLRAQLEDAVTDADRQSLLARVTGNYRRGNERAR